MVIGPCDAGESQLRSSPSEQSPLCRRLEEPRPELDIDLNPGESESRVINYVLGIQYLDPWRACTLFLLLRRLSSEETMSTRLAHNLGCN
jgi:hypothetical protein